jgi:hypothetical protein
MTTELHPRISEILTSEHHVSHATLQSLSADESAQLHSIALGGLAPEQRVKALTVLAASRNPAGNEVFRKALTDKTADFKVRAAGATWLSRLTGTTAEGSLIESLGSETIPIVQHKIIDGLARVGSETALQRLTDMVHALDPEVRGHAQFVQSVIAYRTGRAGFDLPVIDAAQRLPAPSALGTTARMTVAQPQDAQHVIGQTTQDNYGVVGDPNHVGMIQCGRRVLAAVLDAAPNVASGERLTRPAIAGLVAVRAEVDGSFSTGLLVLTWPNNAGGIHISLNRPSGRTMFFGEGKLEGDSVHFKLDAVRAPGAAETTVTGSVSGGRIIDMHTTTGAITERGHPTPMPDR